MKRLLSVFMLIILLAGTGCVRSPDIVEKPIGKGYLNLCISDPSHTEYWQKTGIALQDSPGIGKAGEIQRVIAGFPACTNASATIWEHSLIDAGEWSHVTLQTPEGRSSDGWLPATHILITSNETGTEWSENYSVLVGSWDRTQRGNGARIWYEFHADGWFTYNYDMMGNKDNIQDMGSWTYLGNNTWDLISNVSGDHGHTYISLNPGGKSFNFETEYSSSVHITDNERSTDSGTAHAFDPAVERDIVYVKV